MGLWSGDKQVSIDTVIAQAMEAKRTAYVQSEKVVPVIDTYEEVVVDFPIEESLPPAVVTHEDVDQPAEVVDVQPEPVVVATTVSEATTGGIDLPDHVAAGFYRAVNHQGQANIVQVFDTDDNKDAAVRDFYMHESEGQRWYFIRLETPAIAKLPTFLQ
jgi:hypothetical protein